MFIKIFKWLFAEQTWWEKEAEENGLTVGGYVYKLKLDKENAELEAFMLKKKEDARSRREKWDDYQAEQFEKEKEKVAGYEQVAKMNSAYIAILLKRLGATKDNKVIIPASEVTEALTKYGTWATAAGEGFALYYTESMEKADGK